MKSRDFPGHVAWTETRLNGDHALAFVVIQPIAANAEPQFHLVYHQSYFIRRSDALAAAEEALGRLMRIDEQGRPVFSPQDF
ncbi:hypothetical protein [Pseudomonas sp. LFM046]|uniref:hypothetical protein n=1 Tax=Pseudomonas sp. LFM046 TaxID=1608357 RepID=UPI0009E3A8A5|nr:hypothetical protein [Pseudomonas sp. LFM046]